MTEIPVETGKIVIVVDDRCGLCSGGARILARRDTEDLFRIVPLNSPLGRQLLEDHGLDPDDPASWLYLENGKALTGFEGWARVGAVLGGSSRLLQLLLLIPAPVRRRLYHLMARNRFRFFERDDLCHLPDAALARKLVR